MTADLTTTEDDVYTQLKTVWDAEPDSTGIALVYANINVAEGVAPDNGKDPWARANVQNVFGTQTALGHTTKRHLNLGLLSVEIFVPVGNGLKLTKKLAQVVLLATRGIRTTNGVIFRDVSHVAVGVQGKWYRHNVLVNFEVEEFV